MRRMRNECEECETNAKNAKRMRRMRNECVWWASVCVVSECVCVVSEASLCVVNGTSRLVGDEGDDAHDHEEKNDGAGDID